LLRFQKLGAPGLHPDRFVASVTMFTGQGVLRKKGFRKMLYDLTFNINE